MRDINRIDIICDNLRKLWYYFPDMRLGQLLENYIYDSPMNLFSQEDDITLENIMKMLDKAEEYDKQYVQEKAD